MRCPLLADLPPPPQGKTGWPWTEETSRLSSAPDGSIWPQISIVTPSYNQGEFIEQTIRSVLLQGYPNLEYIIIDGGSTDNTISIIEKYEPWLTYWISKSDHGQSQAINKGFARSTGELIAWINSDDYYYEGAFEAVARFFQRRSGIIAVGYGDLVDRQSQFIRERKINVIDQNALSAWRENWFLQPACFWPKACWEAVGHLDERLHILMDYDLWLRFSAHFKFCFLDRKLACLRSYPECKSHKEWDRLLAEFAIVHVKNGEKERAIDDIFMLYDSLKAEMTGRCASQGVRAALRRELRTVMNRRNDKGRFG